MAKATKNWEFQFREQPLTIANDDHYQVILELIEKHPEFKAGKVWKISYIIFSEKDIRKSILGFRWQAM